MRIDQSLALTFSVIMVTICTFKSDLCSCASFSFSKLFYRILTLELDNGYYIYSGCDGMEYDKAEVFKSLCKQSPYTRCMHIGRHTGRHNILSYHIISCKQQSKHCLHDPPRAELHETQANKPVNMEHRLIGTRHVYMSVLEQASCGVISLVRFYIMVHYTPINILQTAINVLSNLPSYVFYVILLVWFGYQIVNDVFIKKTGRGILFTHRKVLVLYTHVQVGVCL